MCIAIVAKAGKIPERKILKHCFDQHNDGCGYAFAKSGKIIVRKFLASGFKRFWRSLNRDRMSCKVSDPMLIHFRKRSAGEISLENCHPFLIENHECALVHNGTITKYSGNSESDTSILCSELIASLPERFYESEGIGVLLTQFILPSRIAILTIRDEAPVSFIYNMPAWKEVDGIYYSNDSFLFKEEKVSTVDYADKRSISPPWYDVTRSDDESVIREEIEKIAERSENTFGKTSHRGHMPGTCEVCGGNLIGFSREWVLPCSEVDPGRYICVCSICAALPRNRRVPLFAPEVLISSSITRECNMRCLKCGEDYKEYQTCWGRPCPKCSTRAVYGTYLEVPLCMRCRKPIPRPEILNYLASGMHRECSIDDKNEKEPDFCGALA